jgi:hypothetical protein
MARSKFGYKTISDEEIKAVWAAKDLETKRQLALDILDDCIKSSPSIIKIKGEIERTASAVVIDKKIAYLLLVQDGNKVIRR